MTRLGILCKALTVVFDWNEWLLSSVPIIYTLDSVVSRCEIIVVLFTVQASCDCS